MLAPDLLPASPELPAWVAPRQFPDLLTAADPARGVVIATCLRGGKLEIPAQFRVERPMGGSVPDTFTADVFSIPYRFEKNAPFRAGERYAMLLRSPPPASDCEFCQVFHWRRSIDFDVWHHDLIGPRGRYTFSDSAAVALYLAMWRFPRFPLDAQESTLVRWARSPGPESGWAHDTIGRHPAFAASGPVRTLLVDLLQQGPHRDQRWAAYLLAPYPDSLTRRVLVSLATEDSAGPGHAIVLGAHDWDCQLFCVNDRFIGSALALRTPS